MSYSDFGLDVVKKSKDDDKKVSTWLCLWCNNETGNGFSLCFSNWVICGSCLKEAAENQDSSRWEESDYCFKCKKEIGIGYRQHESYGTDIHICNECIDWGNEVINKQFKLKQTMAEFKLVPLKEIKPDPNQPRKFYDETAMQELTDSIKEKGILQPILIRPNGKGKILVCGERRFRAATAAGLTEIPAVIRELSDDEALELQIIENLQRKDVHPLEEAVAFKSLLDKGKDIKEIAARVGKSEFYARQRIKLCALNKDWQKVFYAGRLNVTEALKVALFDDATQKELFEEEAEGASGPIDLDSWTLGRYRGDLNKAAFDLNDATLVKAMGACVGCQFNTGSAMLFENDHISPRCTKVSCFKNKTDLHFNKAFHEALTEPTMLFVHDEWSDSYSDKFVSKAKSSGFEVYGKQSYNEARKPVMEPFDEWKDDNADDYDVDEKGLLEIYQKEEVASYEKEVKEYEQAVAGGKFKKAFMLTGTGRGSIVYVKLAAKAKSSAGTSSSKATKEKEAEGKLTEADITAEIARINEREKRTLEIDQNKIWSELRTHFKPENNLFAIKGAYSQVERSAIAAAIYDKLGYNSKDSFLKYFGLTKRNTDYSSVTEEGIQQMMRYFMLSELPPAMLYSGFNENANACIQVAGQYFPSVLKNILDTSNAKATKRKDKIKKRIAELNEQKTLLKKLAKQPAAATPKPAKKSATKK